MRVHLTITAMKTSRHGLPSALPRLVLPILSGIAIAAASATSSFAEDWPKDYEVHEKTESPDHHYAVLVPDHEPAENGQVDYLADIKNHRVLGKLTGAEYFRSQNHANLWMVWSDDSKWGVLQLDGRWYFESVWVLEIAGGSFTVQDLGPRIAQTMSTALGKGADDEFRWVQLFHAANKDRTLVTSGIARTNARGFANRKTYFAYFHSRYDARAKKWISATARPITEPEWDALNYALNYEDGDAGRDSVVTGTNGDEEAHAKVLDEQLNFMYQALKFLLPPKEFATIKQEQLQWLKKRDATTGEAKRKLVADRIDVLNKALPE